MIEQYLPVFIVLGIAIVFGVATVFSSTIFGIFDLEVIFVYPWAVQFKKLFNEFGISVFISMLVFLVIFEIGYLYVYKKGGFKWD
ncbi:MAG: nuoA [Ignavibacteriaceae bacterium]|nr:nuoA [Ignavibacteriaceae bacterium]